MLLLLLSCATPPTDSAKPDPTSCHPDADHDGFGAPEWVECRAGVSEDALDCDDTNRDISPDAEEICDEIDNDCDGVVDEGFVASTWYADADGDGDGDPNTVTTSCLQPPGTVLVAGDCDDADASVSSLLEEACGDGVDNDCANGDEVCHVPEERSLGEAGAKILPPDESLYFGEEVSFNDAWGDPARTVGMVAGRSSDEASVFAAVVEGRSGTYAVTESTFAVAVDWSTEDSAYTPFSVGDLTGDGVPDQVVLVASPSFDLAFGLIAGPVSATVSSDRVGTWFRTNLAVGSSFAAGLGDTDGDGSPEVALSFRGNSYTNRDGWGELRGMVYVEEAPFAPEVDLNTEGIAIEPDLSLENSMFGYKLCSSDLDGDGLFDLGVGAPASGDIYSGAVVVLLGPFDVDRRVQQEVVGGDGADGFWSGDDSYSAVGFSVTCRMDVDGDGLPDLLFGGPGREDYTGAAWLVPGPALGAHETTEAPWSILGEAEWDHVGDHTSADSDLDGDGRGDIVVTGDGDDDSGYAAIFRAAERGSHGAADADVLWRGELPGDAARAVAGGGDLDSDGFDDLLVGAFHESTVGQYAGAAYVIFGGQE